MALTLQHQFSISRRSQLVRSSRDKTHTVLPEADLSDSFVVDQELVVLKPRQFGANSGQSPRWEASRLSDPDSIGAVDVGQEDELDTLLPSFYLDTDYSHLQSASSGAVLSRWRPRQTCPRTPEFGERAAYGQAARPWQRRYAGRPVTIQSGPSSIPRPVKVYCSSDENRDVQNLLHERIERWRHDQVEPLFNGLWHARDASDPTISNSNDIMGGISQETAEREHVRVASRAEPTDSTVKQSVTSNTILYVLRGLAKLSVSILPLWSGVSLVGYSDFLQDSEGAPHPYQQHGYDWPKGDAGWEGRFWRNITQRLSGSQLSALPREWPDFQSDSEYGGLPLGPRSNDGLPENVEPLLSLQLPGPQRIRAVPRSSKLGDGESVDTSRSQFWHSFLVALQKCRRTHHCLLPTDIPASTMSSKPRYSVHRHDLIERCHPLIQRVRESLHSSLPHLKQNAFDGGSSDKWITRNAKPIVLRALGDENRKSFISVTSSCGISSSGQGSTSGSWWCQV